MYVRVKRKHATVFLRVDPAETAARVKERLQELLQQASEEGFGGRGVGGVSGADAREETARGPPLSTTPPRPQPADDMRLLQGDAPISDATSLADAGVGNDAWVGLVFRDAGAPGGWETVDVAEFDVGGGGGGDGES